MSKYHHDNLNQTNASWTERLQQRHAGNNNTHDCKRAICTACDNCVHIDPIYPEKIWCELSSLPCGCVWFANKCPIKKW